MSSKACWSLREWDPTEVLAEAILGIGLLRLIGWYNSLVKGHWGGLTVVVEDAEDANPAQLVVVAGDTTLGSEPLSAVKTEAMLSLLGYSLTGKDLIGISSSVIKLRGSSLWSSEKQIVFEGEG